MTKKNHYTVGLVKAINILKKSNKIEGEQK
jgi:hypothetical protein